MAKFFQKAPDGGMNSGVTGYFLVELKSLFSIVVLRFSPGSREAYHEHAFSAVTLWLAGSVEEHRIDGDSIIVRRYPESGRFKFTPRSCFHKIVCTKPAWAISIRGS